MLKVINKINITKALLKNSSNRFFTTERSIKLIDIHEEIRLALELRKPVVALESTIITHGMPFPQNIECAKDVEGIIRKQGAVPATIAIINGQIKVGLNDSELNYLGDLKCSQPIKTSRRDLSYVVSNKLNGGTTVSGTLLIANKIGIPIFATGGIGGVHREANETFDISADLIELGKSSVAVISSGIKSILDIPKTLEFLETQGVFVATLRGNNSSSDFPAFYSNQSNIKSPYLVETAHKAAKIIKCNKDLNMQSGMLFAVPVPEENSIAADIINAVIDKALEKTRKILGKEITPFLLSEVAKMTEGKALETNIALIKNNAKTAADIAVELEILSKSNIENYPNSNLTTSKVPRKRKVEEDSISPYYGNPCIIGGSNLDCSATLKEVDIKLDGRIHNSEFQYAAGGVSRNICEALHKLNCTPNFITVLGDDDQGKLLKRQIPVDSQKFVQIISGKRTAQCVVVFDQSGECRFLMGDMEIHNEISSGVIKKHEDLIKSSPLLVLDGNIPISSLSTALELAEKHNVPVLYEPTDVVISSKIFQTEFWRAVKYITPNLNELQYLAEFLNLRNGNSSTNVVEEAGELAKLLVDYVENVIVTLGSQGILIARRGSASDLLLNYPKYNKQDEIKMRHYPMVKKIGNIVNVSGAGDCFAGGLISGMLNGLSEERCVTVGFDAAVAALSSISAVPERIFEKNHQYFSTVPTIYNNM